MKSEKIFIQLKAIGAAGTNRTSISTRLTGARIDRGDWELRWSRKNWIRWDANFWFDYTWGRASAYIPWKKKKIKHKISIQNQFWRKKNSKKIFSSTDGSRSHRCTRLHFGKDLQGSRTMWSSKMKRQRRRRRFGRFERRIDFRPRYISADKCRLVADKMNRRHRIRRFRTDPRDSHRPLLPPKPPPAAWRRRRS